MCIGVDSEGNVLATMDPAANRGWRLTRLGQAGFTGVSCAAVNMCVAVDMAGNVWSSTSLTSGPAAWRRSRVDSFAGLTSVSCPAVSLCVATSDLDGNVFVSTSPTAGTRAWVAAHVEPLDKDLRHLASVVLLSAISCPSTSLCVAVDSAGQVVTSTNPTGGQQSWNRTLLEPGTISGFTDVSCPSVLLCVAVDGFGNVFHSTDPGSPYAWRSAQSNRGFSSVSCPATTLCALGDVLSGGLYTLTDPAAGLTALRRTQRDGTNSPAAISCPTSTMCVAGDSAGNVSVGEPRPANLRVPTVVVTRRSLDLTPPAAKRLGRALLVDPGIAVRCPLRGPSCTVNAKVFESDIGSSVAANVIGRIAISIRAGHQRGLAFQLTAPAAKELIKHKFLIDVTLKAVARDAQGAAVAEQLDFDIAAPS
jgi:hypothetical protein